MRNHRLSSPRTLRGFPFLLIVLASLFLSSCSKDQVWQELGRLFEGKKPAMPIPTAITFNRSGLYPEGVSHDALHQRFLVSSITQGTIGQVNYEGHYTPFIQDSRLLSTVGLKVDEYRKRVLVTVSDIGVSPRSTPATIGRYGALGMYDLSTGQRLHFPNLGALRPDLPHFINDVALDHLGNAYVTDSFSPIIYRVDVTGRARVFMENPAFATNPGEFGLNGIVVHPHGYLLVAFMQGGKLYRIPLDNPMAHEEVAINAQLMGPDGLLLSKDGKQLIVVDNGGGQAPDKIYSFSSDDNWATGTLTETFTTPEPVFATTATGYGKDVFVLYAHLHKLLGGADPPQSNYTIRKMPFSHNRAF
jgi:sugar lactone lactonase YvrE